MQGFSQARPTVQRLTLILSHHARIFAGKAKGSNADPEFERLGLTHISNRDLVVSAGNFEQPAVIPRMHLAAADKMKHGTLHPQGNPSCSWQFCLILIVFTLPVAWPGQRTATLGNIAAAGSCDLGKRTLANRVV